MTNLTVMELGSHADTASTPATEQPGSSSLKAISLFAGCGGLDLGFQGGFSFLDKFYPKTGIEVVWANDISPAACRTYASNLGQHICTGDIWSAMKDMPNSADLILGGFPCQDVSVNGRNAGVSGKKTSLYRAMVEAVDRVRPRMFVAENVKGLLTKRHEGALSTIIADFRALGYSLSYRLYRAEEYGVPQTRERIFIIGEDRSWSEFIPPAIQLFPYEYVTAKMALADLELLPRDPAWNHIWSQAKGSPDQGSRSLVADRPGYTMRAECHGNIHFHYSLARRMSMREAARIQSFPDNFIFSGGIREIERQVGNAVPPVLAWHIAQQVVLAYSSFFSTSCR
jgi:DNA (cytosine-5)-methyltransferase 1